MISCQKLDCPRKAALSVRFALLLVLCILVLPGCSVSPDGNTTPTGLPSNMVQQPQVMYNGIIYYYKATGFDEDLPDSFSYVGEIKIVDNYNYPSENFVGSQLEQGQKIYADESNDSHIYLEYDKGYAKFSAK